MKIPKILVTNAAGKTGFETVIMLLEKGYPVRAMVRRSTAKSELLKKRGAEIFVGALEDFIDVSRAMEGVQRAYFCAPWSAGTLATSTVFAAAAQENKIEVVVVMSQWLADPVSPSTHTRETWMADKVFSWMPNVDTIIVNPGWFADNYMVALGMIAQLGMMVMPLGNGLNAPPSNEDIARIVVGAITNPEPHIGKTYRPTGPKLLSPEEIAAVFAKVLGRTVKYQDAPIKLFSKVAKVLGFSDFQIAQVGRYFEDYRQNAFAIGAPTNAVLEVGGREPEDFETIVRRYVANNPGAKRSFGAALGSVMLLIRAMLIPAPNLDAFEREHDIPKLPNASLAVNSDIWAKSHRL